MKSILCYFYNNARLLFLLSTLIILNPTPLTAQERMSQKKNEREREVSSPINTILDLESKISLENMLPFECQADEYNQRLLREKYKLDQKSAHFGEQKNSSTPNGIGTYQLVAIAVNFSDFKAESYIGSESFFKGQLNYIREYYLNNSSGQLIYDIDYADNDIIDAYYFELDEPGPVGCSSEYQVVKQKALDWLTDPANPNHIPLSAIDTLLFVMPDESACGNSATYPVACGSYCTANVKASRMDEAKVRTGIHEIAHTLAVSHGYIDINNDGVSEDNYGDNSTPMGSGNGTYMSAPNFFELGWEPPTQSIAQNGTYSLVPHPQLGPVGAGSPSVLVIDIPNSPLNYHISIRSNQGYDDTMSLVFQQGLAIHKYAKVPETYDHGGYDPTWLVGILSGPDDIFIDLPNSIKIKQLPQNNNGEFQVQITLDDDAPCVGEEPLIEVYPVVRIEEPDSWVYRAGTYEIKLTNRDDPTNCTPSTFALSDIDLSSLTGLPGPEINITASSGGGFTFQNVPPGQSSFKSFDIFTSQSQSPGFHPVSMKVTTVLPASPADHPEVDINVIYQVNDNTQTTPPTTPFELTGEIELDLQLNCAPYVSLEWQHNSNSPDTYFRIYKDGIAMGESLDKSYSSHNVTLGASHNFTVKAINGNNLESALSNQITLAIPNTSSCDGPTVDYISLDFTPGTNSSYTKMWLYIEGDENIQQYSLKRLNNYGGNFQWEQVTSFDTTFFKDIHNNVRKMIFLHDLIPEPPNPGIELTYRLDAQSTNGIWGTLAEDTVYFPSSKWAYPTFMDPTPPVALPNGNFSQVHLKYDNNSVPYARFKLEIQEQGVITGYKIQQKVTPSDPWSDIKTFSPNDFAYGGHSSYGFKSFYVNHYGGPQLSHKYRVLFYPEPPTGSNVIMEFTN
ncbi:hypothetical protein N9N67_09970 [Bacteriovoracaceae bacterium]|nr:hypothetical protein [Bacteriovoracaceae bacterium]